MTSAGPAEVTKANLEAGPAMLLPSGLRADDLYHAGRTAWGIVPVIGAVVTHLLRSLDHAVAAART